MRTVVVYLLALGALCTAAAFGFPELFGDAEAGPAERRRGNGTATPVIVTPVARAPFQDSLAALGTVRANESVEITPNSPDQVAEIHFTDGQQVDAGDLLIEMNAEEEKARLAESIAIRDERRANHERIAELYDNGIASERELIEAKALLTAASARVISLEATITDREVRAPFSGTLGLRRVSKGAYVLPSTVITTLDDLSVVKLDFTIPEVWLANVSQGMTIAARSDAWPDDVFPGQVAMVDTRLDARTRSATVRALLPNPDGKLRPGMLLKVAVDRGERPVLQIPEESIIPLGERHYVLRLDDDDVAHRVPVAIGRRAVGVVEILDGLAERDRIVVEGIVRVNAGTKVSVVSTRELRP